MQTRTVTFHNEFTDDEDIIKTVEYGQAITDIPPVTAKQYNDGYWSVKDFGCIKTDMTVNAIYETQGLQYTPINQQTQYRVSKGKMSRATKELFIPAEHDGKPVTVIDEDAFYNSNLSFTFAYIPYGITEITARAFGVCKELIDIRIPNSVKIIGRSAFSNCGFTSITIPDSVTSIGEWAFSDCDKLTSIDIPNSVTNIGEWAFSDCRKLTSIDIPNSVTSIGESAFHSCSKLTSIDIPNSVTNIGRWAFRACSELTSIDIPNSVTNIKEYTFYGCSKLTSIKIPNSVTSIEQRAFYQCRLLTIFCEATNQPNGWSSEWNASDRPIVWDCKNNDKDENGYEYIAIGEIWYSLKDGIATVKAQAISNIATTVIPSTITYKNIVYSVTSIGEWAFSNCDKLTSIDIPNSVTSIGLGAFHSCFSLIVTVPDSVTNIGTSAFVGTPVVFFEASNKLENWETLGNGVWDCNNNDEAENGFIYIAINGIYYSLKGDNATVIGLATNNIATAVIQSTITYENSVYSVRSISQYAFRYSRITSITISNNVTSIWFGTFNGCTDLTSIELPSSVTSIDSDTFSSCPLLDTIYYKGTQEQFEQIKIGNSNAPFTDSTVYYYSETEPTDNDFYWHYDTDGVTPVIWATRKESE